MGDGGSSEIAVAPALPVTDVAPAPAAIDVPPTVIGTPTATQYTANPDIATQPFAEPALVEQGLEKANSGQNNNPAHVRRLRDVITDFVDRIRMRDRAPREASQQPVMDEPETPQESLTSFQQLKDTLNAEIQRRVKLPSPNDPTRTVEQDAARLRTDRLRDPRMQGVLRLLSRGMSPDLQRRVSDQLSLLKEGELDVDNPLTRYRIHAPLIGALWRDREARTYLMQALETIVEDESVSILDKIEEMGGDFYTPVVIVGSGPAAAAMAAVISGTRPDLVPLIIEANDRIGGKFAEYGYEDEAFTLNSPSLKEDSPNSLGELSAVDTTHVSAEYFPPNNAMGSVTAIDDYLGSRIVKLASVGSSTEVADGKDGSQMVQIVDRRTGRTVSLRTDCILNAAGPGEITFGVPLNGDSKGVVDEALAEYEAGGVPGLQTHDMFYSMLMGDRRGELLSSIADEDVLIVGAGHSAATISLNLTGKGGEQSVRSVRQQPRTIEIAGMKAQTGPEYLDEMQVDRVQGKYAELAAELPRSEGGKGRVKGVDARVIGYRRDPEDPSRTRVIFKNKGGDEQTFERSYKAVITAPGLIDRSREVYADSPTSVISDPADIEASVVGSFVKPHTTIRYNQGGIDGSAQLESLTIRSVKRKNGTTSVMYSAQYNDGNTHDSTETFEGDTPDRDSFFMTAFGQPEFISRIETFDEQPVYFGDTHDGIPIASQVKGRPVYFVGANAHLPVTDAERQWIKDFPHNINPYAISINAPKAQLAALRAVDRIPVGTRSDLRDVPEPKRTQLSPFDEVADPDDEPIRITATSRALPRDATYDNLLRLSAHEVCSGTQFPEGCPPLEFIVRPVGGQGAERTFDIETIPPMTRSDHRDFVRRLFGNPTLFSTCCGLTSTLRDGIRLKLPVVSGAVDLSAVQAIPLAQAA